MKPLSQLIRIIFLLLVVIPQETLGETSLLFQSDETLVLTLKMDVRAVTCDVGDKREEHTAEISYLSEEGKNIIIPVEVRTRGHFRRDPANCDFPPLRLNFSEEATKNSIFEGQDKLKLLTHCRTRGSKYEQNVLKEYLVYLLYNLFTPESYKVRLAELTYVDSEGKKDTLRKMGFFIEPTKQVAKRNSGELLNIKNVQQNQCDPFKTNVMSIFQYMVGNTDWSVPAGHNIDLLRYELTDPPIAVPYDFDWCGLVNSPYAVPNEMLGIDNVKTRLFRGYCQTEDEFQRAFQEFRDREEQIYKTIDSVPDLEEREREKIIRYIEQFFEVLHNPKHARREFLESCRTN
ncbi:hypothetical protein ACFLTA_01285 [Bacteroidota bacterium]